MNEYKKKKWRFKKKKKKIFINLLLESQKVLQDFGMCKFGYVIYMLQSSLSRRG